MIRDQARILVTGANGLVGVRLCGLLWHQGFEVVGAGRGPARFQREAKMPYLEGDLTNPEQLEEIVSKANPDVVVNTASMTDVDACEKAPVEASRANAELPAQLAELSIRKGFHLLHVSTDYVFDGDAGPYGVDDVPNPRGVYATTKHAGEEAIRRAGGSWAIARTAVVYGWPAAGRNNFGAWLVSSLAEKKGVKLFSDQFVSPSLALNLAQMLAELAARKLTGIWHTCGATVIDRVAFGRALCEEFGFDPALITPTLLADLKLAAPRPKAAGLKVDKTAASLKAQPLSLAAALVQFHAEYRGVSP